jgi:predicted nuclease with TOPRIM domain
MEKEIKALKAYCKKLEGMIKQLQHNVTTNYLLFSDLEEELEVLEERVIKNEKRKIKKVA